MSDYDIGRSNEIEAFVKYNNDIGLLETAWLKWYEMIDYAKSNKKNIHLIGIPSDGGIHSHINHLFALLRLFKMKGVEKVFIHFVGDGRDTPPKSIKKYINQVEKVQKELGVGKIASVVGRFYALDRDKNWDRNKVAYELWTEGKGKTFDDINKAIDNAYSLGETDEFLTPIVITEKGKPVAIIEKGDVVLSYNFRADRERQLAYVLAERNDLTFVKPLDSIQKNRFPVNGCNISLEPFLVITRLGLSGLLIKHISSQNTVIV